MIEVLLLLALPASGKSEIRRYLATLTAEQRLELFGIGETVDLDDYIYVEFFREVDAALEELDQPPVFFRSPVDGMRDGHTWGTLIQLLNQDYANLMWVDEHLQLGTGSPFFYLLERIDRAQLRAGAPRRLKKLPRGTREELAEILDGQAAALLGKLWDARPNNLDGKTVVIEFARGGPDGATMPLNPPQGFEYSLSQLSPEILDQAAILYIQVSPEESRRKNDARATPPEGVEDTILYHGVPPLVMYGEYGCDDMVYLLEQTEIGGVVVIRDERREHLLPCAVFDNGADFTSFVRDCSELEPEEWPAEPREALYVELQRSLGQLSS